MGNELLNSEYAIDKRQIADSFNRAAAHYDEVAILQRQVGEQLLERLDLVKLSPQAILDVGAGTGLQTVDLLRRYGQAQVLALDVAEEMLTKTRQRVAGNLFQALTQTLVSVRRRLRGKHCYFIRGDTEYLPLADQSVDLIFSNLTLQWCLPLDRAFSEFRRVLKPEGLLAFTTLGPDTLKELQAAWSGVDDYRHVNVFLDMHDIGDTLIRARLADPVMDVERYTLTYPDTYALMRDLKMLGARTVGTGRRGGLMGRQRLQKMAQNYEALRHEGRLPATFEVIYGHAWGAVQMRQRRTPDGAIQIPVHTLKDSFRRP